MKNTLFFTLLFISAIGFSQENKSFRIGLQCGFQGNGSYFSGGMENADARFQHNSFGGGNLSINARYDFDEHWMLLSGLGFSTIGFDFALSQNYSLLNEKNRFNTLTSEFGLVEIPLMAFYKFEPNCKNRKWLIGLGFANTFIGNQSVTKSYPFATDGASNVTYLKSESSSFGGESMMLRFSIGRERVFNSGTILSASLLFNAGFKNIANSSVTYTIDGKEFNHQYSNKGNFIGFRLSYYFRALKTAS